MKADAEIKNDSGRRQFGEEDFEAESVRVERIKMVFTLNAMCFWGC